MSSSRPATRLFEVLANTPRLLHLVWQAAPIPLLCSLGVTLAKSLLPVSELYVTKLVVDRVVSS
ncbi:hypothetical protein IQ235_05350, partial [Oscillatoriales cyanobacterium LEGE 11467]